MTNLYCKVRSSLASKKGQGLVEYGLILGGVAILGVAVFVLFSDGGAVNTGFSNLITNIGSTLDEAADKVSPGAIS